MPTAGRFLENLVTYVQRRLAPEGAIVRSPERFYRDGKQIGEIDVTVRGQFGSATVFLGIECRDRPSEGPQGLDWIMTLVGKKKLLGVDKLIAVSTTGFRTAALRAARDEGIDTLLISDDAHGSIQHFLSLSAFTICVHRYEDLEAELHLTHEQAHFQSAVLEGQVVGGGPSAEMPLGAYLPELAEMLLEHLDPELKLRSSLHGEACEIERDEPLLVRVGAEIVPVRLRLRFKLWREVSEGKVVLSRCDQLHAGSIIAHVGTVRTTLLERPLHVFFQIDELRSDQKCECVVQFSNPNGTPFFPPGTPIEMRIYDKEMSWTPRPWSMGPKGTKQRVSVVLHLAESNPRSPLASATPPGTLT